MEVCKISPESLSFYSGNSKTHSKHQVELIANSISAFGFNNPVLIDSSHEIIAGHGRVMAAINLNMDKIPCIILDHLTDDQKKAYVIADNKLTEVGGEWDFDKLKIELNVLIEKEFDLTVIGFNDEQIADLFDKDEEKLKELSKEITPISYTRILISIPTNMAVEIKDEIDSIVNKGICEVDYSGN